MKQSSFGYSASSLSSMRKTRGIIFIHWALSSFVLVFFLMDFLHQPVEVKIAIYGFGLLLLGSSLFLPLLWFDKPFQKLRVHLTPEGIQREDGHFVERLPYRGVIAIKVIEEPHGEVQTIHLISTHGIMRLYGLHDMKDMLKKLEPRMNDLILVRRKTLKFSRNNWLILHGMLALTGALGLMLYRLVPELFPTLLPSLLLLSAFLVWLIRPLSKYFGRRFRIWEIMLSWLCLFLAVWHWS